jgi:SagB-type dehydrogenase family enzyme
MSKQIFVMKKVIIVVIVAAVSVVAAVAYLTWFKPTELPPNEVYSFVNLPNPKTTGTMSVEQAIQQRRSIRSYANDPLSIQDISQLMFATQGITDPTERFRAAPSAGATYPLEVYVVVGNNCVEELAGGFYRYDPHKHLLVYISKGDLRSSLAEAALGQSWLKEAPINIVIAAVYERTTNRYGERGVRYVHMEAGHVGQNIYLQAIARGLGTVAVGAFHDNQVQQILQLPSDQKPLYIFPIGYP